LANIGFPEGELGLTITGVRETYLAIRPSAADADQTGQGGDEWRLGELVGDGQQAGPWQKIGEGEPLRRFPMNAHQHRGRDGLFPNAALSAAAQNGRYGQNAPSTHARQQPGAVLWAESQKGLSAS